ncbi:hypothetical protein A458_15100 [Stutzerimonas stutzeri CCUG 29243]|uniref:Uncharacterized protein n=1 Tax=Stutzerimonas stutzeri CCUG 29243 TaxID=1196835 RepID=I4CVZ2_STUST|nr:hypothetical protein A458_15100 [Stutzerimonas stutzeri CCUG 29243]
MGFHEAFVATISGAQIWTLQELESCKSAIALKDNEIACAIRSDKLELSGVQAIHSDVLGEPKNFLGVFWIGQHESDRFTLILGNVVAEPYVLLV